MKYILLIGILTIISLAGCTTTTQLQSNNPAGSVEPSVITTFREQAGEACTQDGKPIIRLYSTTWCPHCEWVKDSFDNIAKEYIEQGKIAAYHWEMDSGDNTLTDYNEKGVPKDEEEALKEFDSEGYVPAFSFGCKYIRIGNGYEEKGSIGKAMEEAEFRKIIEELISE